MQWLLAIGGLLWFFSKSSASAPPAPIPGKGLAAGGAYYKGYLTTINGYTDAYSAGAITLVQWQGYMQALKDQIQTSRAAGQLTDSDVVSLNNQIGI